MWYCLEFGLYGYGAQHNESRNAPTHGSAVLPSGGERSDTSLAVTVKESVLMRAHGGPRPSGLVDIIVWEAVRSDYFSMIIHHISTLSLLFGSFYFGRGFPHDFSAPSVVPLAPHSVARPLTKRTPLPQVSPHRRSDHDHERFRRRLV